LLSEVAAFLGRMATASLAPISAWVAFTRGSGDDWLAPLAVASISYGAAIATTVHAHRRAGTDAERVGAVIEVMLNQLVRSLPSARGQGGGRLRANVMLADKSGTQRIKWAYGMDDASDRNIALERWQGCAGYAFCDRSVTWADLGGLVQREIRDQWKLTAEQYAATREVRSVVSAPLSKGGKVVGTVNVDSDKPLAESLLGNDEVRDLVAQTAELVGRIM